MFYAALSFFRSTSISAVLQTNRALKSFAARTHFDLPFSDTAGIHSGLAGRAPAAKPASSGSGSDDGGPEWLKMPGWFIPKQFQEPIEVPEVHVPKITLPIINLVSSKGEAQVLQVSD